MSVTETEAVHTPVPHKRRQNIGRRSRADKRLIALMVASLFPINQRYGNILVVIAVVLYLGLLFRLDDGPVYRVAGQKFHDFWIRVVLRHKIWEPAERRGFFDKILRPGWAIRLFLNAVGEDDEIGLIHNERDNSVAIVVAGSGSEIPAANLVGQHSLQGSLASVERKAAAIPDVRIGCSYVFRRRPANLTVLSGFYEEAAHPDILIPEALGKPEEEWTDEDHEAMALRSIMLATIPTEQQTSGHVDQVSTWTVERDPSLAAAARGKRLRRRDVNRLPFARIADVVENGLASATVSNVTTLNSDYLHHFMQRAWSLEPGDYDNWRADRDAAELEDPEEVEEWREARAAKGKPDFTGNPWPLQGIYVYNDHCVVDGAFHAVLQLTENPEIEVLPNYYRQLHTAPVPYFSVAKVGEAVRYTRESAFLNWLIPFTDALEDTLHRVYKSPKAEARGKALQQRNEDLFRSQYTEDYNVLIAVSATDLETLEDYIEAMEDHIKQMGLASRRIKGESRQLPALWTATTGLTML
jgi:hypothetical protein